MNSTYETTVWFEKENRFLILYRKRSIETLSYLFYYKPFFKNVIPNTKNIYLYTKKAFK